MWASFVSAIMGYVAKPIMALLQWILYKGVMYGVDYIKDQIEKKKREAEQKKAVEEYKKVLENPASTVEQKRKSFEDTINTRG